MENTNQGLFPDWSLLASPERRSSDWLIDDITPRPTPQRPVRVLLSVLDPSVRRMLAMGLRLDGHDVSESDDPIDPEAALGDGLTDIVVCGASLAHARDGRPQELIVFSGGRYTSRALITDPKDLTRLRYLVREHREGVAEVS